MFQPAWCPSLQGDTKHIKSGKMTMEKWWKYIPVLFSSYQNMAIYWFHCTPDHTTPSAHVRMWSRYLASLTSHTLYPKSVMVVLTWLTPCSWTTGFAKRANVLPNRPDHLLWPCYTYVQQPSINGTMLNGNWPLSWGSMLAVLMFCPDHAITKWADHRELL